MQVVLWLVIVYVISIILGVASAPVVAAVRHKNLPVRTIGEYFSWIFAWPIHVFFFLLGKWYQKNG